MHGTKRFDPQVHAIVGETSVMRAREVERYLLISASAALRPHQLLDCNKAYRCLCQAKNEIFKQKTIKLSPSLSFHLRHIGLDLVGEEPAQVFVRGGGARAPSPPPSLVPCPRSQEVL